VRRSARAISFLVAAILCAVLAAAVVNGYRARVSNSFGELRTVVVAAAEVPAGKVLRAKAVSKLLEVRRVPASFVPPGALTTPEEAVGLAPAATVSAGGLPARRPACAPRAPGRPAATTRPRAPPGGDRRDGGCRPGSGGAGRRRPRRRRSHRGAEDRHPGRTYVAASGVPLLALTPAAARRPWEIRP
jgi:hypothetical protein